jgi:hypothetical protein
MDTKTFILEINLDILFFDPRDRTKCEGEHTYYKKTKLEIKSYLLYAN